MEIVWIVLVSLAICYLVIGVGMANSIIETNEKYVGKSYFDPDLAYSPSKRESLRLKMAFLWLPMLFSKDE
jgi:hypothetical protein